MLNDCQVKVERLGGPSAVNTTHLMDFQESHARAPEIRKPLVSFKRSGRRNLLSNKEQKIDTTSKVSSNPEPPKFDRAEVQPYHVLLSYDTNYINCSLFGISKFSGWLLRNRQRIIAINNLKKTIEIYLTPITRKVTEFTTIEMNIEYLQVLSLNCPNGQTVSAVDSSASWVNVSRCEFKSSYIP